MLSWPTGGGHGRSLITLISTANVAQVTTSGQTREVQMERRGEDRDRGKEKRLGK